MVLSWTLVTEQPLAWLQALPSTPKQALGQSLAPVLEQKLLQAMAWRYVAQTHHAKKLQNVVVEAVIVEEVENVHGRESVELLAGGVAVAGFESDFDVDLQVSAWT